MALLSRQPSQAIEAAVTLCGGQRAAQRPPCSDGRPSLGHDSGSVYAPSAPGPCVWWPPACLSPHSLLPWVHIPGLFSPRHPQRHRLAVFWLTAEKLVCASACLSYSSLCPQCPARCPHRWLSDSSGWTGIPAPGPALLLPRLPPGAQEQSLAHRCCKPRR